MPVDVAGPKRTRGPGVQSRGAYACGPVTVKR